MEITRSMLAKLASKTIQAPELLAAGYSASDVLAVGYSASDVLAAGYSASALRSAGYSASALRSAGYSAEQIKEMEELEAKIPLVEKPYTKILDGIRSGQRKHDQTRFGPDCDPETNLCKTEMCTAGHLVNLGGVAGYDLKDEFGFAQAAAMIHAKAHPGWPCQDFGMIRQDWALAYIEEMADWEQNGVPEGALN